MQQPYRQDSSSPTCEPVAASPHSQQQPKIAICGNDPAGQRRAGAPAPARHSHGNGDFAYRFKLRVGTTRDTTRLYYGSASLCSSGRYRSEKVKHCCDNVHPLLDSRQTSQCRCGLSAFTATAEDRHPRQRSRKSTLRGSTRSRLSRPR